MLRKAFIMPIYPDQQIAYQRRHNPIWQELADVLKQHGVHNYSIFLDEKRHLLFGYVEIESESRWDAIAKTEICQKWWQYMADVMPTHPDYRPLSDTLKAVFYLA